MNISRRRMIQLLFASQQAVGLRLAATVENPPEDPPDPPSPGVHPILGITQANLATERTRLATNEFSLYNDHISKVGNTVLARTGPGFTNDAGMLAGALAFMASLDPENATMSVFTWPTRINTALKCSDYAVWILSSSTYHGSSNGSKTCYQHCADVTPSAPNKTDGAGAPHTLVQGNPSAYVFPMFLVYDHCQHLMGSGTNIHTGVARLTELGILRTLLTNWVLGALATLNTSAYPKWSPSDSLQMSNQSCTDTRFMCALGAYSLLGDGVLTAPQEEIVVDCINRLFNNRFNWEIENLYSDAATGGCLTEDWCGEYYKDNLLWITYFLSIARNISAYTLPSNLNAWTKVPEFLLKSTFPSTFNDSNRKVYGPHWGTTQDFYANMEDALEGMWMLVGLLRRMGHTTQSQNLRWLMPRLGVNFNTIGSQQIPGFLNTTEKIVASWLHTVIAGSGQVTETAMTSMSTRMAPIGHYMRNDVLTKTDTGTMVNFNAQTYGVGGHYDSSQQGQVVIFSHGAFYELASYANNKGAVGKDTKGHGPPAGSSGLGLFTTGLTKYPSSNAPVNYSGNGSKGNGAVPNTAFPSGFQGIGDYDDRIIGYQYAKRPDHANFGYVAWETAYWGTKLTTGQHELFDFVVKNVVVRVIRAVVNNPSVDKLRYKWIYPVRPTAFGGTDTKTHTGRWTISGTSVVKTELVTPGRFTVSHNNVSKEWARQHLRAFKTILSPDSIVISMRGHDRDMPDSAYPVNMEIQLGTDEYGRNNKVFLNGTGASAHNNGGSPANQIHLTDNPTIDHTPTHIAWVAGIGDNPNIHSVTSVDTSGAYPILTVSGSPPAVASGSPRYYALLDNAGGSELRNYDYVNGGPRDFDNGDLLRSLFGAGFCEILWNEAHPTNCYLVLVDELGDYDDSSFTTNSPATLLDSIGSDYIGTDVGGTKNVFVITKRTPPSRTSDAAWLGNSAFTFRLPTRDDREGLIQLKAGDYNITGVIAGSNEIDITVTPNGGGAFTSTAGENVVRINVTESGGVVSVT